jgi:dTDP-glucose pyrophosphorylase
MSSRLERCCVPVRGTLLDAMRAVDRGDVGFALVADDEQRLVGTMSDGDIRRALLAGESMTDPLSPHMSLRFVAVRPGASRAEVLELMQARAIGHIPVVDEAGRLVGLHLMRELLGREERPNWAVVMAGGMGLRLRPMTEHIPKPMIEVAGRPILERLVLHLVGYGFQRIFLSINYLGEVIERHFGDGAQFGCRIEYLRESRPLGTSGALSLLPEPPNVPILVLNGDLVVQFDASRLLAFHNSGGFITTVAMHEHVYTVPFGVLKVEGSRVLDLEEKPTFSWRTNAGIYVLDPQVVARVPKDTEFPMPALLQDCLHRGEPVGAFPIETHWVDVGRHTELRRAQGEVDK